MLFATSKNLRNIQVIGFKQEQRMSMGYVNPPLYVSENLLSGLRRVCTYHTAWTSFVFLPITGIAKPFGSVKNKRIHAFFCVPQTKNEIRMKTITLGKSSTNDYVVSNPQVSRQHAVLTITDKGEVYLRDLNSTNGTFVDGKRITTNTLLQPACKVKLADTDLDWQAVVASQSGKTQVIKVSGSARQQPVQGKQCIVGRAKDCQVVMDHQEVSGKHAMLENRADGIWLTDMQSTNGTYVNGQKISAPVRLQKGDKVMIANRYELDWSRIFGTSGNAKKTRSTLWIGLTGAVAAVALVVVGIFCYLHNKAWTPAEVYSHYKSSVVLIYHSYTYKVYYKGQAVSSLVGYDAFNNLIWNTDKGEVDVNSVSGTGTGFFIDDKGTIMTNRHVASQMPDELKHPELIMNALPDILELLYSATSNRTARNNIKTIYNDMANVEVRCITKDLSVVMNDTHVNSESDWMFCTFLKNAPDDKVDAALIQLNTKKTPAGVTVVNVRDMAQPKHMEIGDAVYTLGFPKGLTVARTDVGIEANNQSGEITQESGEYVFGHNISIQGGASGSPVFDAYGKFAGIITSGFFFGGAGTSYNYAVQAHKAATLLQ